jgi:hypothetical protein
MGVESREETMFTFLERRFSGSTGAGYRRKDVFISITSISLLIVLPTEELMLQRVQ